MSRGGAPSGRGEYLQWINTCCGAHYTSVEALADGVLYNQLMETLVKKTAQAQTVLLQNQPDGGGSGGASLDQHEKAAKAAENILSKVHFTPRGKEDNEANLHCLHDCLRRCVLPRKNSCEIKVDRLAEGKLQDHMVFLKWLYQHTQKVHQLIQKASSGGGGAADVAPSKKPTKRSASASATTRSGGVATKSETSTPTTPGGLKSTQQQRGRTGQPTTPTAVARRSQSAGGKALSRTPSGPPQRQRLPPPTHNHIEWNDEEQAMMAGYNPHQYTPTKADRHDSVDDEYSGNNSENDDEEEADAVTDIEIAEICGELQAVEERLAKSLNQQSGFTNTDETGYETKDVDFGSLQELLMERDSMWQTLAFVAEVVENKTAQIEVAKKHGRLHEVVVPELLADLASVFSSPSSQLDRV